MQLPHIKAAMLRRSSTSKKDAHVVWDEENLRENEEIQKQYSSVRIAEPKTPYRPPLPSDSLDDDLGPLQLDEGEGCVVVLCVLSQLGQQGVCMWRTLHAGVIPRAASAAACRAAHSRCRAACVPPLKTRTRTNRCHSRGRQLAAGGPHSL